MFGALYQGEMGILIAAYLFSRGLVNPSQFNIAIIVVVYVNNDHTDCDQRRSD